MQTIKNHVTLVGNMGTDVQVTNFENGAKIARFNLATKKSGKEVKPEWHRVFAWGNIAQFLELHGKRGKNLIIHGRLVNRTFLDKDGQQQKVAEVEIKHVMGL